MTAGNETQRTPAFVHTHEGGGSSLFCARRGAYGMPGASVILNSTFRPGS